jgi:hypothetical protein
VYNSPTRKINRDKADLSVLIFVLACPGPSSSEHPLFRIP